MALRGYALKRAVFVISIVSFLCCVLFTRYASKSDEKADQVKRSNRRRNILLFVAIYSAPRHHDRRNAVRETWMKKCVMRDKAVCWFITNGQDVQGRALTGPVRKNLDIESSLNGDMVFAQSPGGTNFARTYIWMAQWAKEHYDFQYLLRVDDDYFVCFDKLLLELEFHRPKEKLIWGWLHCQIRGIVAIDAGFQLVTRDIIESILSRVNTTLLCTRFDGQAMGMWLKDYHGLVIFGDNQRLFHLSFDSNEKAAKRKEICQTALGIHKSYPKEMEIYWNVYQREPKNGTNFVPPIVFSCGLPVGVDYRVYGKKYFAVPKLCKEKPVWSTTYKGRLGI